ncbi:hypothetical protein LTR37_013137 [Vermiconidia calcicola]|uniref:Uncharacterized protein n=1 Tax=Vermiconidia calcicola TaxID=1690605 RepID=A0ACC3MXU2_9PEZI|nr:hypothetical protein LTR37_013137 [Vermiconidia calcicola]
MRQRPPQRQLTQQPMPIIIDDNDEALNTTTPATTHTLTTTTFAHLVTSSFEGVDLNTRFAAETPRISFATNASKYVEPMVLLTTSNPALACIEIKKWLVAKCGNRKMFAPGAIRMEGQKLHGEKMKSIGEGGPGGWLLLAEDAAHIHSSTSYKKISHPISILAVIVPGDPDVRWFYTVLPISSLLKDLSNKNLLDPSVRQWHSGSKHHKRLYTFLTTAFTAATTFPDSEDYRNAEQITDCCPPILDPQTVLVRLECNSYLYFAARKDSLEIGNDRYLTLLEPAEREVAGMVGLKCAEYLLIKRVFFRSFFEEVYRSEKSAEVSSRGGGGTRNGNAGGAEGDGVAQQPTTTRTPFRRETTPTSNNFHFGTPTTVCESNATPLPRTPAAPNNIVTPTSSLPAGPRRGGARTGWRNRVRTEHAHQIWLENEYEFRSTRAKMLVVAWRELGFLDEGRFWGWVRAGGMFEGFENGEGEEGVCERLDGDEKVVDG